MISIETELVVYEQGRRNPAYTLDTDLSGQITLEELLKFTKASLIVIADAALKEEQARGFDKNPTVIVDGRRGKPIANVNPLGSIEFYAAVQIDSIIMDTYEAILGRSPVDTGLYKSSHYVFKNGTQVATDMATLKAWLATKPNLGPTDLIRFVNIQPYARKLERYGVTAQRQKYRTVASRDKRKRSGTNGMILAPNGTYFLTFRSIRRKYKNNAGIKFGFISGSHLGLTGSFKKRFKGENVSRYLYPSISILLADSGVR